MDNKYLYMFMASLALIAWFMVGHQPYFVGMEGELATRWMLATVLAVGLGAGDTGGVCAMTTLKEAVVGFIPQMIVLAFIGFVGTSVYDLAFGESAYDVMHAVQNAAGYVVAGLITSIMMSYMKKAV